MTQGTICLERLATAVRTSTLARLVRGDRAVTVCERSLGCTATPLTCAAGYALLAARAIQLGLLCMAAQQCVSAYGRWACALGFSPPVLRLPVDCRIAHTNSLRRLLLCGRGAIGARTVGSACTKAYQRSLLDSGAAGGDAVTYCCLSLSGGGHSLVLCGCLCLQHRCDGP